MKQLYESILDDNIEDKLDSNAMNGLICKYFRASAGINLNYTFRNGVMCVDTRVLYYEGVKPIKEVMPFITSINMKGNVAVDIEDVDVELFKNCVSIKVTNRFNKNCKVVIKKEQKINKLQIDTPFGGVYDSITLDAELAAPAGVVGEPLQVSLPQFNGDLRKCKSNCELLYPSRDTQLSYMIEDLVYKHQNQRQRLSMQMETNIPQKELDAIVPHRNFPNLKKIQYDTHTCIMKDERGEWYKAVK